MVEFMHRELDPSLEFNITELVVNIFDYDTLHWEHTYTGAGIQKLSEGKDRMSLALKMKGLPK